MSVITSGIPADAPPGRLIVDNILEWGIQPERRNLPEHAPPAAGTRFAAEGTALYWSGGQKIVVTRHAMDPLHIADCRTILGYENLICRTLRAEQPGNSICADLTSDERDLADLAELLDDGPAGRPLLVEGCASTPEYAHLIASLRKLSKRVIDDRMTEEPYLEVVSRLDSKVQSREFFFAALRHCRSMRMTRAFAARRGSDLARCVQGALPVLGPVIVKTDFGAGGHSMAMIESAGSAGDALTGFLPAGYDDDLLVEEYLGSSEEILSVSYNGMVEHAGEISTLGAGRHLLHSGRSYTGSYLGIGSVPPGCAEKIRDAGEAIGQVAAYFGYRGPLNIDFLYRESDGVIFPLEINPRRTLGASLAEVCLHLFGPEYDKSVSAIGHRRIPVHPSITKYSQLRDALLRRGFFGHETPGLMVLPYLVGSLAADSVVGLMVVTADGTPARGTLNEISGYLAREARGSLGERAGSDALDESEFPGRHLVEAAREQLAHFQPARLQPDDRLGADGRRQHPHVTGSRRPWRPHRDAGVSEGVAIHVPPVLHQDRTGGLLREQLRVGGGQGSVRPGLQRQQDRVAPRGEHRLGQLSRLGDVGAPAAQVVRDERGERVVAQHHDSAAIHGDPRIVELLHGHGTEEREYVDGRMALIGARDGDTAGPAGVQVHVRPAVLPALVHQRYHRGRLQPRHHRRVDRADLTAVGNDVRRPDDVRGLLAHQLNPVGHPGQPGQARRQGRELTSRGVAGPGGQGVDVRAGQRREDRGHHVGTARRLGQHRAPREVQLAALNGRLHQPDQAPGIEPRLIRSGHVLPAGCRRPAAAVITDTTRSCSSSVIWWNSGRISELAVSRSVTGSGGHGCPA